MQIKDYNKNQQELAEIYQVAHMYYDLNQLQSDIAATLYMSRPKVSRLLAQAREIGMVEIHVNPFVDRLSSLENALKKKFKLKDAIVLSLTDDQVEQSEDILAVFAAQYISGLLSGGGVLGIDNSPSINRVLKKLTFGSAAKTEIVQLIGATSDALSMQETTLILSNLAASNAGLTVYPLSAPLYVNDLYLKEMLQREATVHNVFQKMNQCTTAFVGISPLERDIKRHLGWSGLMSSHHIQELIDHRAVGCICSQYYDINGVKVSSEWNAKTISMKLADFTRVDNRIASAVGLDKIRAIYSALRGHLVNVLITDAKTATDVLNFSPEAK